MAGTDRSSPEDPRLCHGPDLGPIRGTSPLTTFAHDVERDLLRAPAEDGFKFESDNSLDIERELNELMGTLTFARDGSEVNLAYERTDPEETAKEPESYWSVQRKKSKSFIERCRFLRNGRERMSMFEFGSRRRSPDADAVVFEPRQPRFVRLACDRSSAVEPRVSSLVSLPARPESAREGRKSESKDSPGRISTRTSCYEEDIDWTWLEEAMKNINEEVEQCALVRSSFARVDAGCQTQSEQSWTEEERMRGGVSAPDPDSTDSCVTSECRAIGISGCCDEDMSGKPIVENNRASGVSSWLRESMRRVRHFNLGEPPRIRSAPPDSLRLPDESVVNVENSERVNSQNEVQQQQQPVRTRTACSRLQRRSQPRSRPTSLPARRPPSAAVPVQSQTEIARPVPLTAPAPEAQENMGYESDSTDRHPSPRG
ncbi:UNVERIFIED_CONTAM: hypothetical protein PYX00_003331 [Menopon gallinae]|uniref:Uncharacterized protein n=1 Tax=Menopon gallinae TaxID=328185 RepID=A0AAW2I134_9NEOP